MYNKGTKLFQDCLRALKFAYRNELTYRASALTFTTLLALVPMISVFVYLMRHFYAFLQWNELAKTYIIHNFMPSSSREVIAYLDTFTLQASELPVLSIVFLFFTTTLLLLTIDASMKSILQVKGHKRHASWLMIYPLIVLCFPIFIGAVALLSSFLLFLFDQLPLIKALNFVVPLSVNSLLFSLLYFTVSADEIQWNDILYGGCMAAFLLELAKILFVMYFNHVTSYEAIYGALSVIPIFFIWLYVFWFILLYGVCLTKVRFTRRRG